MGILLLYFALKGMGITEHKQSNDMFTFSDSIHHVIDISFDLVPNTKFSNSRTP